MEAPIYLTISEAVDEARGGDIVTVRAGVYREEVYIEGKSGTPGKPVVIRSDPSSAAGLCGG